MSEKFLSAVGVIAGISGALCVVFGVEMSPRLIAFVAFFCLSVGSATRLSFLIHLSDAEKKNE